MTSATSCAANDAPEPATTIKCLIWDLDDTLWDGILLERDDVLVRAEVRHVVKTLDARGILQSVASRNDHDHAWARLTDLGLAQYFVAPHIGWGRKSAAVRSIASRLRFAHRAIGFIDDQPAERAEVGRELPDVRCYPAARAVELPQLREFSPTVVTVDARRRREMYQAGLSRDDAQTAFAGPDEDFLRSLGMTLLISKADQDQLFRIEELTLRTSQMNATGVHYSDEVLRRLLSDSAHDVLVLTMSDRFGPHGAVGVVLLERHPRVWHLKLLATSCRVVNFGAGATLLRWLANSAAEAGVHLLADFRRTDRNRIMEITYRFAGFTDEACWCRADVPGTTDTEVDRVHLIPDHGCPPSTMTVFGPGLTAAGADDRKLIWT